MMDADAMYPEGFHPIRTMHKPDYSGYAPYLSRSTAGVKYYFIDFGISVHIPADVYPKLVTGHLGRDQTPPELSKTIPYDPFKLDVYIIGNMFKRELTDVRSSFNIRSVIPPGGADSPKEIHKSRVSHPACPRDDSATPGPSDCSGSTTPLEGNQENRWNDPWGVAPPLRGRRFLPKFRTGHCVLVSTLHAFRKGCC